MNESLDKTDFHEYFKMLGLNIAYYRKMKSLSQDELAEAVGISRAFLGAIEAPNIDKPLSLNVLFSISKVLEIPVSRLFENIP